MVQMNLRSSKHLELTTIVHYSPGQIEEPFLGRSFCKWPKKVRRAIWLFGDPESRTKYRPLAITRYSFNDLVAFLNAKIHRLIIGKTDSWKAPTDHFDCQFIAQLKYRFHLNTATSSREPPACRRRVYKYTACARAACRASVV